jgi:UDP-N-acetyl-D-mannosaminuronate dehydrogenase
MMHNARVAVVGLGEVGKPLLELLFGYHDVLGVDVECVEEPGAISVLHICYPFEIADFVGETARYIDRFRPNLTVINSTVAVGTTRKIVERTGTAVVHSPIRGKHARMLDELRLYTKFIGGTDRKACIAAAEHFQSIGLKTMVLSTPEATELAKLAETTYFGVLIAWAQEIERFCDLTGGSYDEVVSFFEEINYLPRAKYWPGVIGGHCVMPNIEILGKMQRSPLLEAIHISNEMKIRREAHSSEGMTAASR